MSFIFVIYTTSKTYIYNKRIMKDKTQSWSWREPASFQPQLCNVITYDLHNSSFSVGLMEL